MVFLKFIFREGERERGSASRGGAEGGIERISSRLYTVSTETDVGLEPTSHEIMAWLKSRVRCLTD